MAKLELQLNYRKIILNNQLNTSWRESNLITKDLWKKLHHHDMTGRECRGTIVLAGLQWVAAELLEGIFQQPEGSP